MGYAAVVQSKQDLAGIVMNVQQNRFFRIELHLGMAAVSVGMSTAIAGFLGMNLDIPTSWLAWPGFAVLGAGSTILALCVYATCASYAHGWLGGCGLEARRVEELKSLQSIFRDHTRLDHLLTVLRLKNEEALSRETFLQTFTEVCADVDKADIESQGNALFTLFDSNKDGWLQLHEVPKLRGQ